MNNSTLNILKTQAWKTRKNNLGVVNNLVGDTGEDERENFLTRLGQIAYAREPQPVISTQLKYRSKWFFTLPEDYAELNKNTVGPENLPQEPENIEFAKNLNEYKDNIATPVQSNMRQVSDFILNELSPKLLGLQAGIEEARSIIEHTVGEVDSFPFTTIDLLTKEAIKLKLARFCSTYYGLPLKEAKELTEKILVPKQREVVIPYHLPPQKDKQ